MLSSAIDWERIERFVGFGRPDAPVVFVGTRIVLTKHFADRSLNATESLDHLVAVALS